MLIVFLGPLFTSQVLMTLCSDHTSSLVRGSEKDHTSMSRSDTISDTNARFLSETNLHRQVGISKQSRSFVQLLKACALVTFLSLFLIFLILRWETCLHTHAPERSACTACYWTCASVHIFIYNWCPPLLNHLGTVQLTSNLDKTLLALLETKF